MARSKQLDEIRAFLRDGDWRSPNTYSNLYADIPAAPAVYLFLAYDREDFANGFIAYVGMSTNLAVRMVGHPIYKLVDRDGFFPQRWFKPTPAAKLRDAERRYISQFQPPYNIVGRRRGVA